MSQSAAAVKRHGKHYTPAVLADFLADRVLGWLELSSDKTLRILDPACGDGELLLSIHRMAATQLPSVTLALDLDAEALRVAQERSDDLGIGVEWHQGDFLHVGRRLVSPEFDVVITNPRLRQGARTVIPLPGLPRSSSNGSRPSRSRNTMAMSGRRFETEDSAACQPTKQSRSLMTCAQWGTR